MATFKILEFFLPFVASGVFIVLAYTDLLSIAGCRMLINIKEAADVNVNIGAHSDSPACRGYGHGYGDGGSSGLQSTFIETAEFAHNSQAMGTDFTNTKPSISAQSKCQQRTEES